MLARPWHNGAVRHPALHPPSPWIQGPRYDLLFFGGALALGLLAVLGVLVLGLPPAIALWFWIVGFDGPHMAAAYSRTYLDRDMWRTRRPLLLGVLVAFATGPAFLALNALTRSQAPFALYLGLMAIYGYHHIVRQHWGFCALYASRGAGDPAARGREARIDKLVLHAGCWIPYVHFLASHPSCRAALGLGAPLRPETWFFRALGVLFAGLLVVYLVRARARVFGVKDAYLLGTVAFHGGAYFLVARFEPVFPGAKGPDQEFMLLSVMVALFHATQYVAIVWAHNARRYGAADDARIHGLARVVSGSPARYAAWVLGFSVVLYFPLACATGVYPVFHALAGRELGPFVSVNQVALAVFWGIALHHYWLDERIWKIGRDTGTRAALLGPSA